MDTERIFTNDLIIVKWTCPKCGHAQVSLIIRDVDDDEKLFCIKCDFSGE